jgi:hypothetical protein
MEKHRGRGFFKKLLLWMLFLILLGGAGYLGYTYKITNDSLRAQSQRLSAAYKTIGDFQKIIDTNKAEKDFVAEYNSKSLSFGQCGGKPLAMFDVHLNDQYAVYRYLCANSSAPIRVAAFKKAPSGNAYSFTYGASALKPDNLPSYIFDTEPGFFGPVYGAARF